MYIEARGHHLDYEWLGSQNEHTPLVFLHEGLGSIELWRTYPSDVVAGTERRGLVFSRYGHGRSDVLEGHRNERFMHEEALRVLPGLIDDLVGEAPILIGHSDGASISLIYAGSGYPVLGMVLIAPHVMVETTGLGRIEELNTEFAATDLSDRLGKYHDDPAAVFRGWADVWLSDQFRDWNLEEYLQSLACPILMIQSENDAYGTLEHLDIIEAQARGPVERLVVPGASHSPHLTHSEVVTAKTIDFVRGLG